jgi:Reverse transcriptase (RNA-dependent DNA polymerase)
MDSLGDARIFSTLDCNSGYWQIPVDPADRAKTTFTSHEGLYWFLRMPFGLRNAPVTFQRFVDITLAGLTWKTCHVYLDDIIVFSKTAEEHLSHLDEVLHRLVAELVIPSITTAFLCHVAPMLELLSLGV